MKHIAVILLLIFQFYFVSCLGNNNSKNISQSSVVENQDSAIESNPEEKAVRDMINEMIGAYYNSPRTIIDMAKVNFGVPDCENWLVTLQSHRFDGALMEGISLFLIKDGKIIERYFLGPSFYGHAQYDIMKDIPGMRSGSGASAYGDYNGDGVIELFQYAFGGNGNFVIIWGYDEETDKIVNYCGEPGIPFGIVDPVNGPAPVEFMIYNGRYGFKVYYEAIDVAGGPNYVPEPMPRNRRWFFYAWDEAKKMYVEIGEVFE